MSIIFNTSILIDSPMGHQKNLNQYSLIWIYKFISMKLFIYFADDVNDEWQNTSLRSFIKKIKIKKNIRDEVLKVGQVAGLYCNYSISFTDLVNFVNGCKLWRMQLIKLQGMSASQPGHHSIRYQEHCQLKELFHSEILQQFNYRRNVIWVDSV